MNISAKAPLFGIIGRITEKKGQLFLIESLLKLKQKGIIIELLIFGSATVNDPECQEYYNKLLGFVKLNELNDVVHFVEYQDDISLFYNAVDVFVLASHSETYGMVTIEAMLSQLPIIATKSGGTAEILDSGKLGLLYEYNDYEDFCRKIIWLMNNKTETESMAYNARKTAVEKYRLENEINEIDSLIESKMIQL
ncbi:MAG: glycosyltransferase family 4 protein [Bacteroidota bacterium]